MLGSGTSRHDPVLHAQRVCNFPICMGLERLIAGSILWRSEKLCLDLVPTGIKGFSSLLKWKQKILCAPYNIQEMNEWIQVYNIHSLISAKIVWSLYKYFISLAPILFHGFMSHAVIAICSMRCQRKLFSTKHSQGNCPESSQHSEYITKKDTKRGESTQSWFQEEYKYVRKAGSWNEHNCRFEISFWWKMSMIK